LARMRMHSGLTVLLDGEDSKAGPRWTSGEAGSRVLSRIGAKRTIILSNSWPSPLSPTNERVRGINKNFIFIYIRVREICMEIIQ